MPSCHKTQPPRPSVGREPCVARDGELTGHRTPPLPPTLTSSFGFPSTAGPPPPGRRPGRKARAIPAAQPVAKLQRRVPHPHRRSARLLPLKAPKIRMDSLRQKLLPAPKKYGEVFYIYQKYGGEFCSPPRLERIQDGGEYSEVGDPPSQCTVRSPARRRWRRTDADRQRPHRQVPPPQHRSRGGPKAKPGSPFPRPLLPPAPSQPRPAVRRRRR